MLANILPVLFKVVPLVIKLVPVVERLVRGVKQGTAKRELVVALVLTVLQTYEGFTGKDIADEVKLAEGVGQIVDGVVAVLNATGKLKVS
jgi:hypothetical protein